MIEEAEEEMLYKVFDFAGKEVHEVMVPRPEVVAISVDLPPEECLAAVIDSPYTRYPAYKGSLDDIVGHPPRARPLLRAQRPRDRERQHRGAPASRVRRPRDEGPRRRCSPTSAARRCTWRSSSTSTARWRGSSRSRTCSRRSSARSRTSTTFPTRRSSASTTRRSESAARSRSTTSTSSSGPSCRRRTTTRSRASSSACWAERRRRATRSTTTVSCSACSTSRARASSGSRCSGSRRARTQRPGRRRRLIDGRTNLHSQASGAYRRGTRARGPRREGGTC